MIERVALALGAVEDLMQLDTAVRKHLYTKFIELVPQTPNTDGDEQLQYDYCRYGNTLYRVIYRIDRTGKLIIIALVSDGENLYQELAQCIY